MTVQHKGSPVKGLIRTTKKKEIITKLWYLYSEVPQEDLKKELIKVFVELGFSKFG